MIRSVRRLFAWGSRVGPGRWWTAGIVTLYVALVVAALVARERILGDADPAETLATAATLLPQPLRLPTPLDVVWSHSVRVADDGAGDWNRLLRSPLPPPLCAPGDVGGNAQALNAAVRRLDRAIADDAPGQSTVDRALEELNGTAPRGTPAAAFVADYNLARAHLAMADPSEAARLLDPLFERGYVGDDAVPHTRGADAPLRLRRGETTPARAAVAYHARMLAASAALERDEPDEAILHLRRGLNHLHYVIAGRGDVRGHYQRVDLDPGAFACGRSPDEPLSSMDGYTALVRAYLEAEGFRNPRLVAGEVRRGRFDVESGDPLAPLLAYAERLAPDLSTGPIPANFVWAASNLQRVYHHNRRDPDPRLEVARAVLVFRIAGNDGWLRALEPYGNTDACGMLFRLTEELTTGAERVSRRGDRATAADSALAAVGVLAFARTRASCGETVVPDLPDDVRSEWLLRSGRYLGGGLIADYEARRVEIAGALAARNATGVALADRIEEPLAASAEHLDTFRSGRNPPALPARIDPGDGRRIVEAWRRGLFGDAASALLASFRGESPGRRLELTTRDFPAFHRTLDAAIGLAGRTPADLYPLSEFDGLARSGGRGSLALYTLRYHARSHPVLATIALVAALLAVGFVLLLVHVSVWRYRLLTGRRFYAEGLE